MSDPYPVAGEESTMHTQAQAPAAAAVRDFLKESLPLPDTRRLQRASKEAAARVAESLPDPVAVASAAYERIPNPRVAAARAASSLRQLADFYDDDYVNMGPTLALGVPIFLFFLAASVFLEVYVLSTATAHLAIFAVGSYVVFSTYFVADHFMRAHSASYDAIADDKKFYVLSNLIKSAVLLAYTPSCIYTLYRAMNLDEWSTPRIRNMGVLYAIPDTVSLLLVTRMAWSTRVHHLCVVGFMVVNLFVTYEEETVARALVVYAVFSTFAYLVNLLLASRFLPVSPRLSLTLSVVALVIYSGCLAINWIWQVRYLGRLYSSGLSLMHGSSVLFYLGLISLVVRDDCVLVKWLWKNVGRQWDSAVASKAAAKGSHDGQQALSDHERKKM